MEDANGGLSVIEGSIPIVGWKNKTIGDYEGCKMGGSWQKGTQNNGDVAGLIGGFQYIKVKDNIWCDYFTV